MRYVDLSPGWARRRIHRHLARRGSGRIIRWITIAAGGHPDDASAPDSAGAANVLTFPSRQREGEANAESGGRGQD
ncbi:hypothetical protein [Methylobacterium durans]|uniref:Uncharacterized protein n=1 Tax=Methylobacterium durans TaxID=2202825 RepID=A0A2U8W8D6_9HYPH|nr:hypothetical protein [Methylobacterium durans]AWN42394.1 hypothetical protein DK389_20215 [Methylobacterium durans]